MLATGPLGALGAGDGAEAAGCGGGAGAVCGGGAEAVCGGGDAVPRDAGCCRRCERGVLPVVGFGGVAATSSGVALPVASGFALAVRCDLPVRDRVAAAVCAVVAADSICWACCYVDGFGTAAVRRARGGWRVNGRRLDGLAPPAFSERSRPGNV